MSPAAKAAKPRPVRHKGDSYADLTHRPLYALVFVVAALAFSHIGAAMLDSRISPASRTDLLRFLHYFHITARFLAPLTVVAVLIGQHVARRDPWSLRPSVLAGMVAEGFFWTLPLIVVGLLRGQVAAANGEAGFHAGLDWLCADIGAAVYEEFVFRLLLINLAMLIFVDVLGLKEHFVLPAAVLCSAVAFAFYHPLGQDQLFWARLITHSLEGLLWGTLLIYRGFGICVLSHISWNLFVHLYYAVRG
ncbi:MAG: CPBP family intramembrane glutamic endopeptidase [Phycisphaerae bacterium]